MKKIWVLGLGLMLVASMVSSCKSSKESAYKAAYDQAKQQELVQGQAQASESIEITPVTSNTPTTPAVDTSYREEKVVLASGAEGSLKAYSVVCGSFASKTNAEALQANLVSEGYSAIVVQNPSTGMYRVVCASYNDRQQAAEARAKFKAEHPGNADFQKAWLLYNK